MKFSIIIPCLNSRESIDKCINSILNQGTDIEVIVIDGGSTDGTVDIIRQIANEKSIVYVSEKDSGVYFAMNKGIKIATGDVISILNANDFLLSNVLLQVEEVLTMTKAHFAYGSADYINVEDSRIRITPIHHKLWRKSALQQMPTPHVGLFVRSSVMKALNGFDTTYKIVADQDFAYRLSCVDGIQGVQLNYTIAELTPGGMSSGIKARLESYCMAINNGRPKVIAFFILIKQVVYAKLYHTLPVFLQKVANSFSRHKRI